MTDPQRIPLQVGSDFKLEPVEAKFPDQPSATGSQRIISFDPTEEPVITEQAKQSLATKVITEPPPTSITVKTTGVPVTLLAVVLVLAAVLYAYLSRRK